MALSGERAMLRRGSLAGGGYGAMENQLAGRRFICGQLSIAGFAAWPWVALWKKQRIILDEFPNLKAGFERVGARESVQTSFRFGPE
jgi:glutathione S-transferase/GST-like protein